MKGIKLLSYNSEQFFMKSFEIKTIIEIKNLTPTLSAWPLRGHWALKSIL